MTILVINADRLVKATLYPTISQYIHKSIKVLPVCEGYDYDKYHWSCTNSIPDIENS